MSITFIVRDESLNSELKQFSSDFNLSSSSSKNDPRVTSPASVIPESPKQHPVHVSHTEPPCAPVQEVKVSEEIVESPAPPLQTLYNLQEAQAETNAENLKTEQINKSVEENTSQSSDKIVVQTSKLNPNAKEFVFNPNTKPFIPVST